jgi:hypothetical protein
MVKNCAIVTEFVETFNLLPDSDITGFVVRDLSVDISSRCGL